MIRKFHGIDRHKNFSTISVLDLEGKEVYFKSICLDLRSYIGRLGPEDAVIMEASTGTFYWADQVEAKGALCFVLNPYRFKIIKDSWNKTDKQDARNMGKALWVYMVTGEFGIPTVFKPSIVTRELRKLFSQYDLLNRQITTHKNNIQAICTDNGIALPRVEKNNLLSHKYGLSVLEKLELSPASRISIKVSLELLWKIEEAKEKMSNEIILTGEPLRDDVELLITIKGITPLTALAFLADIADINRFKSLKHMNAYLGLVPKSKDSGGKRKPGHINRESRKLTRTLLTQSVRHIANSSLYLRNSYSELRERRGAGRARIAIIRKVCGIMRRMLLNREEYRWIKKDNFEKKLKKFEKGLEKIKEERKSA